MSDTQILANKSEQIATIISDSNIPLNQQKDAIRNLLKDIEGQINIQVSIVPGGNERISKVDVAPATINLFENYDISTDNANFVALANLYAAYLYCQRKGEAKQLFNALLEYERVTHYPMTKCSPDDVNWMMIEASMIIDGTLIQTEETSTGQSNPLEIIQGKFSGIFQ